METSMTVACLPVSVGGLAGWWTGEWHGVPSSITRRMNTGIGLIVVSFFIIGYIR